jgi:hypothetical protein
MSLSCDRLEAPPRTVDVLVAAQMLLGGGTSQVGWLILGFGSIFFWFFAWHGDLSGLRLRRGRVAEVAGAASGCKSTGYSVGGSDTRRGTPVYENRYRYSVGGEDFEGRSFDTGHCVSGGSVVIEYLIGQPGYSRIRGMRRDYLSPWALLAALLPGAGLIMVLLGVRNGRRRIRLLRIGVPAVARIVEKVPTGSRTMGKVDYRVTLDFMARDGSRRSALIKTNEPEKLGSGGAEYVLYDPDAPDCAVAVAALPGRLTLDHAGRVVAGPARRFLAMPAVTLLLNAWIIFRHL